MSICINCVGKDININTSIYWCIDDYALIDVTDAHVYLLYHSRHIVMHAYMHRIVKYINAYISIYWLYQLSISWYTAAYIQLQWLTYQHWWMDACMHEHIDALIHSWTWDSR